AGSAMKEKLAELFLEWGQKQRGLSHENSAFIFLSGVFILFTFNLQLSTVNLLQPVPFPQISTILSNGTPPASPFPQPTLRMRTNQTYIEEERTVSGVTTRRAPCGIA